MVALGLVVVWFVVAAAVAAAGAGVDFDIDGFRVEVECSSMWVFRKLGGNFVV